MKGPTVERQPKPGLMRHPHLDGKVIDVMQVGPLERFEYGGHDRPSDGEDHDVQGEQARTDVGLEGVPSAHLMEAAPDLVLDVGALVVRGEILIEEDSLCHVSHIQRRLVAVVMAW